MSRRLFLGSVALAFLCSSCASTAWVRPGTTAVESRKSLSECQEEVHESQEFRSEPSMRAEMRRAVEKCMVSRGYVKGAQ